MYVVLLLLLALGLAGVEQFGFDLWWGSTCCNSCVTAHISSSCMLKAVTIKQSCLPLCSGLSGYAQSRGAFQDLTWPPAAPAHENSHVKQCCQYTNTAT
jgi:hypothetical protein